MPRLALLMLLVGCQEYSLSKQVPDLPDAVDTDVAVSPEIDEEPETEPADPVHQEETPEVPPDDPPVDPNVLVDEWTIADDPPVDILFALDKSCSMTGEVMALGNAFSSFIQQLNTVTQGWHIGVVTKDTGCFNDGWMTASTPGYTQRFQRATQGLQLFNDSLQEALLEMSALALDRSRPGRCNHGFVRPDAALHIIAVSDEAEQSGTAWNDWVDVYRDAYDVVVVSAVADIHGICGEAPDGYTEAVSATGGLMLDVCNSQWARFAADLGDVSAEATRIYPLSGSADPSSITVELDAVVTTAWSWDSVATAVILTDAPPAGSHLRIQYEEL